MQTDPLQIDDNAYHYCYNDPVNYVDPRGLFTDIVIINPPREFIPIYIHDNKLYIHIPDIFNPGLNIHNPPELELEPESIPILDPQPTYYTDEGKCEGETPERGVGGKGWRGDETWRDQVRDVENGGDVEIDPTPSVDEALDLVDEAGGSVDRIDSEGHPPEGKSTHTYPHVNYTTASGKKGTIRIK